MTRNNMLTFCLVAVLLVSGCESEVPIGPGVTFDGPSASAVMLRAPTSAEQVQQGEGPLCIPAVGCTLSLVVTGKSPTLNEAATEMKTDANGTKRFELIRWANNHGMSSSGTTIHTTWTMNIIIGQIKAGYYVIPHVNESAVANSPHAFIIYGVDGNRILVSDSNQRLGMNLIGIDAKIFQEQWQINTGSKDRPTAHLIFVDSRPAKH